MSNPKYKFSSLKVFGSVENMYQNVKRYRRVYDVTESRYLYAELAFFNKYFDEQAWNTFAKILCINVLTGEQVCELTKELEVKTDQNMVYIREGWGTPEPGWWKKGHYRYDAYLDNEFVGSTEFHIVERGLVEPGKPNPYFNIKYIKLFDSPRTGLPIEQRHYLKTFDKDLVYYVNAELKIELKDADILSAIPLEFQFNFYNDSGQHKCYMEYFTLLDIGHKEHIFDVGYGAEVGGFWFADKYTLEVVFMDRLIAVVPFEVGEESEDYDEQSGYISQSRYTESTVVGVIPTEEPEGSKTPTFEEASTELQSLIGLGAVKREVEEFAQYLKFLQFRKEQGFKDTQKFNLHAVFMGNPGTGKTSVARMLGQIYLSLNLLSKGEVHEVGRADLVAEYIGQTAPKVKKLIEKARGGVLFVDEAYALSDRGEDGKDFGKEVIEILLKEMSDGPGDIAIVFAGYPKEMQTFLSANAGLASRIGKVIHFPDYTPDELMLIAEHSSERSGVVISPEAKVLMHKKVVEIYRNRDTMFGNARFIIAMVEEAKQHMGLRLIRSGKLEGRSKEELSTLTRDDVEHMFGLDKSQNVQLPIDEALLQDSLAQLRELIGMAGVKKEVEEMVKLVRYYREINRDVKNAFSIHTVFTGNPGTGKTTVARLLVSIYKALGILERGQLVETDRKGMVAGFLGQTAIKTSEMIDKAIGGGLFIDEAYALSSGGENDFGREAIETLLKRMEDQRGQFMVIVAGYPKEMRRFLEANPGLMSRFDKQLNFDDYSSEDLLKIADYMFDKEGLVMDDVAREQLAAYLHRLQENKHQYFGNARTVRKVVAEVIRRQNLRLASLPNVQRTPMMIRTVVQEDVKDFTLIEQHSDQDRKAIGFGR